MAAATEREKAEKKRLQAFLGEILRVGAIKGFQYFTLYLRGREELLCSIINELKPESGVPLSTHISTEKSSELPLNKSEKQGSSLMLSIGTQQRLSGLAHMNIGLPPASPSDKEITPVAPDQTLFLIAGYARYNCPYVWIRSHHHRLVNLTHASSADKDNPLKLNATNNWGREEIHLWDILAELVHLCTVPAPRNPFALDLVYFQQLPLADRVTSTGAMVWLLQQILKSSGNKEYTGKVFEDLHDVTKLHFHSMQQWAREKLPQQQQQQQQQRPAGGGYRPGVQRGPTAVYGY
ncbi:PREDICTED: uncharacterized protein LOC109485052 isoform X1 [Branchiostoma belcheri]|uniref:Uncharacterized protein LOC109485052 isoform X1 n=1 Tax=Branchiostoma belcheri TaxID=7741 RepID=A0A6P5ACK4_BRABE|nr:PREDICTED: uncharacterized protein LOC109485052 isoform X1 [Branchiostoma belcheri]